MRYIIILVSLFFSINLAGQNYMTKTTAGTKAMKPYRKAKEYSQTKQYAKAIEHYSKAIELCPSFIDAYLERGDTYVRLKQDDRGEEDLLKVVALDPHYKPKVLYALAAIQWRKDDYDGVIKHAQMLLDSDYKSEVVRENSQRIKGHAEFAKVATKNPLPFDPKPLPPAINTEYAEYLPSMSADETEIIFSRVLPGINGKDQEDFFISEKRDGEWSVAEPIHSINTPRSEGSHTVTSSGDLIVFAGCNRQDGFGSCDLYYSEKKNGQWIKPKNMGSGVNSPGWDTQPSLSKDGKYLYFASKRKGSLGGSDIYVCKRFEDGVWSKPVNLGDKINTPEDEVAPFIHSDDRTLYFVSKGHPGMGGYDIYKVQQELPFQWSDAENIGYPINTKGDESTLYVSLDGQTGYFARKDAGKDKKHDIYSFEMPKSIQPDPVTYVKGYVKDAATGEPIVSSVLLYPTSDPKTKTTISTDVDGTFMLALPIGVDYSLNVDKTGYTFYSDRFELANQNSSEPFEVEIPLQEIRVASAPVVDAPPPAPIILKNVFFETGSAALRDLSFVELDKLYQLLEDSPSLRIQVNGHTDDVGDDSSNQALSENRAKSVYQYLIDKGIEANRITYKGYGESQPIADNTTAEGKARNRRTEFVVLN